MRYELLGGAHARLGAAHARLGAAHARPGGVHAWLARLLAHPRLVRALAGQRGQGPVEYVGLVLLVAVLIAGVVKASGGFSDTGIAEAVVEKLKEAIDGVGEG